MKKLSYALMASTALIVLGFTNHPTTDVIAVPVIFVFSAACLATCQK